MFQQQLEIGKTIGTFLTEQMIFYNSTITVTVLLDSSLTNVSRFPSLSFVKDPFPLSFTPSSLSLVSSPRQLPALLKPYRKSPSVKFKNNK